MLAAEPQLTLPGHVTRHTTVQPLRHLLPCG